MKFLVVSVAVYVLLVLETSAQTQFTIGGISPVWPALALVAVILAFKSWHVVLGAAAVGLLIDCAGSGLLGIGMLSAVWSTVLVHYLFQGRRGITAVGSVAATLVMAFTYSLLIAVVELALADAVVVPAEILLEIFGGTAYTTAIAGVISILGVTICQVLPGTGREENALSRQRWSLLFK